MDISKSFPIWDKLTPSQQQRLRDASDLKTFPQGAMLHDGSPQCLGMLLVQGGQLRAYLLSEEGREVTICRFFEGDICLFSASCVMPSMDFNIMIEAEKECSVWVIPACLYQNFMEESLPVANYSHSLITSHLSDVMWLMEQIMWKSFDRRLADFLLEESAVEGSDLLKITHEKIANHMGTAREVVTRMLRYFQSEGMVRLSRGAIELTDRRRLSRL